MHTLFSPTHPPGRPTKKHDDVEWEAEESEWAKQLAREGCGDSEKADE